MGVEDVAMDIQSATTRDLIEELKARGGSVVEETTEELVLKIALR